jgi:hypothetical protein
VYTTRTEFFSKQKKNLENIGKYFIIPLTPELNPSAQRCLTRFFTGDFAS